MPLDTNQCSSNAAVCADAVMLPTAPYQPTLQGYHDEPCSRSQARLCRQVNSPMTRKCSQRQSIDALRRCKVNALP